MKYDVVFEGGDFFKHAGNGHPKGSISRVSVCCLNELATIHSNLQSASR